MTDLHDRLHELSQSIEIPEPPDFAPRVVAAIQADRRPVRRWRWASAVAAVAITVVTVVAVIPASREAVLSWLGIRGVEVVDDTTPPPTTPLALDDLGPALSIDDAAARAGFDPLVPSALGAPDAVHVTGGSRIWLAYRASERLPETGIAGVGALITEFETETLPGLTKVLTIGTAQSQLVDIDGRTGLWIEGPHALQVPELALPTPDGRSAGNTLIWETEQLTLRLETALDLTSAVEIARSFE